MISQYGLGVLLANFDGEVMAYVDRDIGSDDGMDPGMAEYLEENKLVVKAIQHRALQYYKATPLGLRVIEAAVRAANEELAK